MITLRKATADDAHTIFDWRNAPETRKYSFHTEKIAWEEHLQWYNATLARNDRIILIGEVEDKPIGVLRYDLQKETHAIINVYLVPGLYGKGWGTQLIAAGNAWINQQFPAIQLIIAEIKPDNIASQKAFRKAGFSASYTTFHYQLGKKK